MLQVRVNRTFRTLKPQVLSLYFSTVLEPLSREIRSRCPEELLYADDLALVSELLEGLKGRLEA